MRQFSPTWPFVQKASLILVVVIVVEVVVVVVVLGPEVVVLVEVVVVEVEVVEVDVVVPSVPTLRHTVESATTHHWPPALPAWNIWCRGG